MSYCKVEVLDLTESFLPPMNTEKKANKSQYSRRDRIVRVFSNLWTAPARQGKMSPRATRNQKF